MDDVWLHVFAQFRPRDLLELRRVCRTWKTLVAESIRRRRSLDVHTDFPGSVQEPESLVSVIESHGPALQEIIIRVPAKTERYSVCVSEYHLNKRCIQAINNTAFRLKRLKIERMILTVDAMEELAFLPTSLKEISIVNCAFSCSSPEINEMAQKSLKHLFSSCELTTFEITMKGLSFEHFELTEVLLNYLPKSIQNLNISAGKSLQIKSLDFLAEKRLKSLSLQRSFISCDDLSRLTVMAKSLVSLDLTSCINILECSSLGQLHNLRNLSIGHMRDGVDDRSLLTIISGCQHLESLNIEDLPKLTEASLYKLGSLKRLRLLMANGVSQFNDKCCLTLLNCQELSHLSLNFCRNITEVGVSYLLRLPRLAHLEVLGVPSIRQPFFHSSSTVLQTIVCNS